MLFSFLCVIRLAPWRFLSCQHHARCGASRVYIRHSRHLASPPKSNTSEQTTLTSQPIQPPTPLKIWHLVACATNDPRNDPAGHKYPANNAADEGRWTAIPWATPRRSSCCTRSSRTTGSPRTCTSSFRPWSGKLPLYAGAGWWVATQVAGFASLHGNRSRHLQGSTGLFSPLRCLGADKNGR